MKYDNRKKADKLIRSSAAEYLTYVAAAGEMKLNWDMKTMN